MAAAARVHPPSLDGALLGEVVVRTAACPRERVAEDVVELLGITPDDVVLELGCGSGRMLSVVASRLREGRALGIDPSELMLRHARLRLGRWIAAGRVELRVGGSARLAELADRRFDAIFGVHVVYFWEDPRPHLAEIRRVLREGGRLLLGFWPGEGARSGARDRVRFDPARAERCLRDAGFDAIRSELRSERGRLLAWTQARG
jgi:SAM-dependent methyltransferase